MGNQCSSSTRNRPQQYQLIAQYHHHRTFNNVKLLRNQRTHEEIAVKELTFKNHQQRQDYQKSIQLARAYENIPTLMKVLNYQRLDVCQSKYQMNTQCKPSSQNQQNSQINQIFRSRLVFQLPPPTLQQILVSKLTQLHPSKPLLFLSQKQIPHHIQMHNYLQIQTLAPNIRKYINLHFQQIEIVRMIDHIIGASYFLHHFQRRCEGIRPDNILVDEEGKFILVDIEVVGGMSNWKLCKRLLNSEDSKDKPQIPYLAPELWQRVEQGQYVPQHQSEKAEIFSVGLIAVEMAFLQSPTLLYSSKQFNRLHLKKMLLKLRNHYSAQFVNLLEQMLQVDPQKRIDFSNLIDRISPILISNLTNLQKTYCTTSQESGRAKITDKKSKSYKFIEHSQSQDTFYQLEMRPITNPQICRRIIQIKKEFIQVMGQSAKLREEAGQEQNNPHFGNCQKQELLCSAYDIQKIIEEESIILQNLRNFHGKSHAYLKLNIQPNPKGQIKRQLRLGNQTYKVNTKFPKNGKQEMAKGRK